MAIIKSKTVSDELRSKLLQEVNFADTVSGVHELQKMNIFEKAFDTQNQQMETVETTPSEESYFGEEIPNTPVEVKTVPVTFDSWTATLKNSLENFINNQISFFDKYTSMMCRYCLANYIAVRNPEHSYGNILLALFEPDEVKTVAFKILMSSSMVQMSYIQDLIFNEGAELFDNMEYIYDNIDGDIPSFSDDVVNSILSQDMSEQGNATIEAFSNYDCSGISNQPAPYLAIATVILHTCNPANFFKYVISLQNEIGSSAYFIASLCDEETLNSIRNIYGI